MKNGKPKKKPNPIASALADMRWKGVTKAERSVIMTRAIETRWARVREKERNGKR